MGGKKENSGDRLRDLVTREVVSSVRSTKRLYEGIDEALSNNPQNQLPEITAALHTVQSITRAVSEVIEARGEVIFSRNGRAGDVPLSTPDSADASPVQAPKELTGVPEDEAEQSAPEEVLNKPKTFGELLVMRIDTQLLPEERTTFTSQELYEIVGSKLGVKKALKKEGLSSKQKEIAREEMIRVIVEYLITPKGSFIPRHSYERTRFIMPFLPIHAGEFNRWSEEIGHDWSKSPEVDHETAMQIRGLAALNKLLVKRK